MKLSPLRKEVQSLNKELEQQNIQIKDLINFLSKSTPKETQNRGRSPRSDLKKLLKMKDNFSQSKMYKDYDQRRLIEHEPRHSKSAKHLKPFYPFKQEQNGKDQRIKEAPMTKSVTFHNIQNALTTRKYLKLSRPEKKINASCSFCKQQTVVSNIITETSNISKNTFKRQIQRTPIKKSKQLTDKILQKNQSESKMSLHSKSKQKLKENLNSGKKTPFKQLNTNEILSKNQMKSFIEKKSINSKILASNTTRNNTKLGLKQGKTGKTILLTKK